MKQSIFLTVAIIATAAIAFIIYIFVLGNPANFANGEVRTVPNNLLGTVYTGGIVVPLLITLTLLDFTLVFERMFSLKKAQGRASVPKFLKEMQGHLMAGRIDDAIKACDKQRGSAANIIRTGLERFKGIQGDKKLDPEKKMAEVQRAIEEASSLETPLLERNLVALSTIASIATMLGSARHDHRHDPRVRRPRPRRRPGRHPALHRYLRSADQHGPRPAGRHHRHRCLQFLCDEGGQLHVHDRRVELQRRPDPEHEDVGLRADGDPGPCRNSNHTDRAFGST